jgi:hypothetical protein
MRDLQLYINNERVSLFEDESISLTQTIQNAKDIGSIFTDFSQSFNLPASSANNKIFKHYANIDIVDGFDASKNLGAQIDLNYVLFRKGYIVLEGVELKDNKPNSYKITFFGETVDLKKKLNEVTLQDVFQNTTQFNHDYNLANVKSGLISNNLLGDSSIIYPLISHTERFYYNTSENIEDSRNLQYTSPGRNANNHGVNYKDLKPAIKLEYIIDRIEAYTASEFETGLTFERTGKSFFNIDASSENYNELYDKMYLWLSREKGLLGKSYTGGSANRIEINSMTAPTTSEWNPFCYRYDSNYPACENSKITDGIWRVKTVSILTSIQPRIDFETNFKVVGSGGGTFSLSIENITDGTTFASIGGLNADGTTEHTLNASNFGNTSTHTEFKFVLTSDSASFSYTTNIDLIKNFTFRDTNNRQQTTTQTSTVTTVAPVGALERIIVSDQMPDLLILDYLTGLFKMFNLTAFFQDDGKIMVQTLDSYYEEGSTFDVTEYIDVDSSSVNYAAPYKEVAFRNEEPKTFLATNFSEINNKVFGNLENSTKVNDVGTTDRGSKYVVKTPFEKVLYERLTSTNIQWGYSVDEDQEPTLTAPLIFVNERQFTTDTPISFIDGDSLGTASSQSIYNRPSNSSTLQTINFGSEVDEFSLTVKTNTLFNDYYFKYISGVFDSKRRMVKLKAVLPLKVLLNYSLADRFIVNGRYYNINSITTNLQTGKSELELLNNFDADLRELGLQNQLQYQL